MSSVVPDTSGAEQLRVSQEGGITTRATTKRDAVVLFFSLWLLYVLLRSPIYIGDAVRWLPTVVSDALPSEGGGARHYFFTWYAWLAYNAGKTLGIANDVGQVRTGAIAAVQGTNAMLAAASVAFAYLWLRLAVRRLPALIAVAFIACSSAFVLHATNMTEPAPALAPALLGIYLISKYPEKRAVRVVAGLLMGLATAFYLIAAVMVVPTAWIAAMRGPSKEAPLWRRLWCAGEHLAPSGLCYAALITLTELLANPERGLTAALLHPIDFRLYGIYGEFRLRSLVGAWFGFASSLYPFPASEGMSRLFRLPAPSIATILGVFFLTLTFLAALGVTLYRARRRLASNGRWLDVASAGLWLMAVYCVAVYFIPGYDKIWLFASFPIALLVAIALDDSLTASGGKLPSGPGRGIRLFGFVLPGLVLLAAHLAFVAVPRRLTVNRDVVAAISLSERVGPHDLVVCRGWDGPSAYMRYALRRPLMCLSLVDESLLIGRDPARLGELIQARIRDARAKGGRVYFLGVLEVSRETWGLFFGSQLRLPFEMFDAERRRAVPIANPDLAAVDVQLFEIPPGA